MYDGISGPLHLALRWQTKQSSKDHSDIRHTLVGNSWSVPVIAWLISQICGPLGLCPRYNNSWTSWIRKIKLSDNPGCGGPRCVLFVGRRLRQALSWSASSVVWSVSRERTFS